MRSGMWRRVLLLIQNDNMGQQVPRIVGSSLATYTASYPRIPQSWHQLPTTAHHTQLPLSLTQSTPVHSLTFWRRNYFF